ncbi:hypothetical protein V7266_27715 [Neobacillus drentensis]|uniref:hypothetical protein n=1 Tax=Neobacillus drentensis TaxID=220684 RepID=UPI002FFF1086
MLYYIVFSFQAAQNYHGAGLAPAIRTDLVTAYEGTILKNLIVTKKWLNLILWYKKMVRTPPLATNRKEIAKDVQ